MITSCPLCTSQVSFVGTQTLKTAKCTSTNAFPMFCFKCGSAWHNKSNPSETPVECPNCKESVSYSFNIDLNYIMTCVSCRNEFKSMQNPEETEVNCPTCDRHIDYYIARKVGITQIFNTTTQEELDMFFNLEKTSIVKEVQKNNDVNSRKGVETYSIDQGKIRIDWGNVANGWPRVYVNGIDCRRGNPQVCEDCHKKFFDVKTLSGSELKCPHCNSKDFRDFPEFKPTRYLT